MARSTLLSRVVDVLKVDSTGAEDLQNAECIGIFVMFDGHWYWYLGPRIGMIPLDRGQVNTITRHYNERKLR